MQLSNQTLLQKDLVSQKQTIFADLFVTQMSSNARTYNVTRLPWIALPFTSILCIGILCIIVFCVTSTFITFLL